MTLVTSETTGYVDAGVLLAEYLIIPTIPLPFPQEERAVSKNKLYCGDNLDVMRHCIANESIDLVYLDPPFKSDQNYNLLFREKDGSKSASQILAFEDTWEWNLEAERNYAATVQAEGKIGQIMVQFRTMLGDTDMLAYLSMMAPRLIEMRRVLKPSGSIYLHCDSTASHYLKLLMDSVFGPQHFRNEIIWKRTSSHNDSKKWAQISDTILFYAGPGFTWNPSYLAHDPEYVKKFYRFTDERGQYRLHEIIRTASMGPRPNLAYEYKGYTPEWGWRMIKPKVQALDRENRITWSSTGRPYLKRYLREQEGTPISSIITDIPPLSHAAAERLGYPTQKPQALLERIIFASSKPDDVILDPFCGCGTAIEAAAHIKNRRWIGIDITVQAIRVTRNERLPKLGAEFAKSYDVIYRPCDITAAEEFASEQPFAFQDWAVEKLNGVPNRRRSGDRGIDGRLYFREDTDGPLRQILVSVKGGKLKSTFVRELQGAVARERAPMGVLIVLQQPSKQMLRDAASSGFYVCSSGTYPKIQIISVRDILSEIHFDFPPIQRMDDARKRNLAVDAATQIPLPGIAG